VLSGVKMKKETTDAGECLCPFRSVAQVGGAQAQAQLSSALSLTVSFVRAGKGRDETTIRRGVRREQHCNSATRRPHVLRGSALRRRQVGPRHPPAATRQETAAPQQVRPPGAEPARFAGNSFRHPPCFLFIYCLQQQ